MTDRQTKLAETQALTHRLEHLRQYHKVADGLIDWNRPQATVDSLYSQYAPHIDCEVNDD